MNLIATKTHIGAIRSRNTKQIHQVNNLLEWTHDQYCKHQFEEYCLFVEKLCDRYPSIRNQIMYSAHFRGMWNNEWAVRNDYDFIPFAVDSCSDISFITDEYLFIHNHIRLLQDEAFMDRYNGMLKLIRKEESLQDIKEKELCYG